jgi:hypothetical protein
MGYDSISNNLWVATWATSIFVFDSTFSLVHHEKVNTLFNSPGQAPSGIGDHACAIDVESRAFLLGIVLKV